MTSELVQSARMSSLTYMYLYTDKFILGKAV
jgi:hypothetical protein